MIWGDRFLDVFSVVCQWSLCDNLASQAYLYSLFYTPKYAHVLNDLSHEIYSQSHQEMHGGHLISGYLPYLLPGLKGLYLLPTVESLSCTRPKSTACAPQSCMCCIKVEMPYYNRTEGNLNMSELGGTELPHEPPEPEGKGSVDVHLGGRKGEIKNKKQIWFP